MPTTLEYMQFATRVYAASIKNEIDVPPGWSELDWQPDIWDGFSAGAYYNQATNELVISYTGTNSSVADPLNWTAGLGVPVPQIFDAMSYYFRFKKEYPEADITFTGHSLGGGLASLMAVFFDKKATVFDEAPFQAAALSPAVLAGAAAVMAASTCLDGSLVLYLATAGVLALTRESNITQYYVEGEVLNTIRFSPATLVGSDNEISLGVSTASTIERHSMALLTALQASPAFLDAARKLPTLVTQLLDTNIYATASTDPDNDDILRKLLRNQFGISGALQPNGMLDRFGSDMQKIAQPDGLTMSNDNLTKALSLFVMQMYYVNPDATNPNKQLFTEVPGGIRFDRRDIAETLDAAKGFTVYFQNYLNTLPVAENEAITQQLPDLLDWYIQAGYKALEAQAGDQRTFMLGNDKGDNLFGGTVNDVLVGGKGTDLLMGGKGDDILIGGDDNDFYLYRIGDGNDRIIDNERSNRLIIKETDGSTISDFGQLYASGSNQWTSADGRFTLTETTTWTLHMPDGGSIDLGNTFQNGDFGIHLAELPTITTTRTIVGDLNPLSGSSDQYDALGYLVEQDVVLDSLGNVVTNPSVSLPTRRDYLYDSTGNDRIRSGGGDDIIASIRGGSDILEGGSGNDLILDTGGDNQLFAENYGAMNDLVNAGEIAESINAKGDLLSAGSGNDQLYGSNRNDVLFGGGGNDLIVGGGGDDVILADYQVTAATRDWGVTIDQNPYGASFTNINFKQDSVGGADNIYAGSGNDFIYAGGGDDSVDGGSGNDIIYGEAGNDSILGGAGDDIIQGDANWLDTSLHGNDYIDGGAGNDKIAGLGGNDELFGDQTLLTNGQVAANGFSALHDLDSNADGVIDASDAANPKEGFADGYWEKRERRA